MKRAVIVMFDSLNRRYLPPYGNLQVIAPNFSRLQSHAVQFENSYAASLPCMPARRELHTGRINFLHRGWSPLEPFDDSMPEMLKNHGIYTHLVSDHTHYWEDGGATYHNRYSSWENIRGQEGDHWIADLNPDFPRLTTFIPGPDPNDHFKDPYYWHETRNRSRMTTVKESCARRTAEKGIEFLDLNHDYDHWMLQIEFFDPHEPFFTYEEYLKLYDSKESDQNLDWPPYAEVRESDEEIMHLRTKYQALISQCDENLGMILDKFDEYDLWKDTMLIVNTDHGFLLGEHGWWAKNVMPCYDEIVHTPLFIWDPESKKCNEKRNALVQTIDIAPTLLDFFGLDKTKDMQGHSLRETVKSDKPIRDYALFGYHGKHLNITDGRYVYMMSPDHPEEPVYSYTLMPTDMASFFGKELEKATLTGPFSFTKNMPVLKVPSSPETAFSKKFPSKLFDLKIDPDETTPIDDPETESRMKKALYTLLKENDAPDEIYRRFDF